MKKTLLFLLLAVASVPAFAQGGNLSSNAYGKGSTDSRNTGFGIKGGYNLSSVRGDDIQGGIDRKSRSGFHGGLYGQFGLNNFSSVQVELLYSRLGFDANTGVGGARQQYRLDYLSLPVMYVGNFTNNLSFHIGPQVSLLNKANLQDKAANTTKNLGISQNGFNSFDFGGVAGLEARIGPARIGARYNLSLGKLFEDGTPTGAVIDPRLGNSRIYNNLVQVYVGIGITQ